MLLRGHRAITQNLRDLTCFTAHLRVEHCDILSFEYRLKCQDITSPGRNSAPSFYPSEIDAAAFDIARANLQELHGSKSAS